MAGAPEVLKDVLTSARSKNAGPFSVSFDLFFPAGCSWRGRRASTSTPPRCTATPRTS